MRSLFGDTLKIDMGLWIIVLLLLTSCAKRVPMSSIPPPQPTMRLESITMPRAALTIGIIPIGLYTYPSGVSATDWNFFKAAGMAQINANYYAPHDYKSWPQYADQLHALGMKMLVSVGEEIFTADAGVSLVRPIANHPALMAVMLADEPVWLIEFLGWQGHYAASKAKWLAGVARWRQELPQVKLASVEAGVMADSTQLPKLHAYYDPIDYVAVDYYPYSQGTSVDCKEEMRRVVSVFSQLGKPVWSVMQGSDGVNVVPTSVLVDFIRGSADGGASYGWWWFYTHNVQAGGASWNNLAAVTKVYGVQNPVVVQYRTFIPMIVKEEA